MRLLIARVCWATRVVGRIVGELGVFGVWMEWESEWWRGFFFRFKAHLAVKTIAFFLLILLTGKLIVVKKIFKADR